VNSPQGPRESQKSPVARGPGDREPADGGKPSAGEAERGKVDSDDDDRDTADSDASDRRYGESDTDDGLDAKDGGTDRGRRAEHPGQIPRAGWRDILLRVWQNLGRDSTSLVAAGIGLNALLAVFPALAVIVSIYGMFASPDSVGQQLGPFLSILPGDAAKLITDQLQSIASPKNRTLGFGAIFGTVLALWNSRQGVVALMTATNIAYNQRERRGFFRQVAISLAFSLCAMVAFLVMLLLGVALPLVLQAAALGSGVTLAILVFRWVLLWSFAVLGFSVVYRYAPDREAPKWRWVTWGSVIAATLWLLGSLVFALYVQDFGNYGKTYGALGGVIVLLMWFYLMGFTIVLGAEINAETEHQTAVDTTDGPPAPMGQRGAYVADTLGHTPE
jgi:membrane protein